MRELADSTRTAADARAAVESGVAQIVESLVFVADGPVLCLCTGDRRLETAKFSAQTSVG